MKSINRISLLGHVVAKPELRKTKTGKNVTSFAVATNNEWLDTDGEPQRSVDFHRVVAWEKLAEISSKHLDKGTPVYIEGRLSNRRYEGKDGMPRFITEVISRNVNILNWKASKKQLETVELAA